MPPAELGALVLPAPVQGCSGRASVAPGQDNELGTPSPAQPSPGATSRKDKQTLHPYHTQGVPKAPDKPRARLTSLPTLWWGSRQLLGTSAPKLELRVLLISLRSPEQGEGTVTAAQLFTPGREFLCQWFQYQTAELCLVCGWKAALLLF